jgi:predicted metal-dependent hydrolase
MSAVLILSIILLILLFVYYKKYGYRSVYVKSNIDEQFYLVRDLPDKQMVANSIAYIKLQIQKLIEHMLKNSPKEYIPHIENLNKKFNSVIISENIYDFYYTSYSVNKGEQLVFCMRSRKNNENDKQHNINLMMYVVLHEISHIACPEYGHTKLFKDIFKHITESAIEIGIYTPIDFKNVPTEYCGMMITDSIV